MQLQLFLEVFVLSSLAVIADCRHLPAGGHGEVSMNCSMGIDNICSSIQESDEYSIQLDTKYLESTGEIQGECSAHLL